MPNLGKPGQFRVARIISVFMFSRIFSFQEVLQPLRRARSKGNGVCPCMTGSAPSQLFDSTRGHSICALRFCQDTAERGRCLLLAPEAASLCQPWSRRTSSEASYSQVSSCTAFKMYEKHIALEKHCGRWQLRLIYAQIGTKVILRYYSQRRHVRTDLH